jgi:predicted RNase H-like HicB family nuclease/DNA-binding XRE family transcriptional regulator
MVYHFKIHAEEGTYWAECLELEGCFTQGKTLEELKSSAVDALNLHLDEAEDSKVIFPMPTTSMPKRKDILSIPVDPGVAFAMLLRQTRIAHGMTQKRVAAKLGMANLYSYQRLERRANPTLMTIKKVKEAFPEFPLAYVL